MCSRFHFNSDTMEFLSGFPGFPSFRDITERDVHPGDETLVLKEGGGRARTASMRWGFVGKGGLVFNGRRETVMEKPMFQSSFAARRAVIPASWFYEWNRAKERSRFEPDDGSGILLFAGIWRMEEDGEHFLILTTDADEIMRPVHDRMPLMIGREEIDGWLGNEAQAEQILERAPERIRRVAEYEQLSLF